MARTDDELLAGILRRLLSRRWSMLRNDDGTGFLRFVPEVEITAEEMAAVQRVHTADRERLYGQLQRSQPNADDQLSGFFADLGVDLDSP